MRAAGFPMVVRSASCAIPPAPTCTQQPSQVPLESARAFRCTIGGAESGFGRRLEVDMVEPRAVLEAFFAAVAITC